MKLASTLKKKNLIFWDFDGVIKDSVEVKSVAYERLFLSYGVETSKRVRQYHEDNGGVSRFDKIPLFLKWSGELVSQTMVQTFCDQFSQAVMQAVIDSPWVPGAREYLLNHHTEQYFVLVTATPQDEIEQILETLELLQCFREIFGAPTKKRQAIKNVLDQFKCSQLEALVIGDSVSDVLAAQANAVPFLLRRTPLNLPLHEAFQEAIFDDFNDE
jgi:phosphoglycolate phosphatase-like HAD superfamily hydrolase